MRKRSTEQKAGAGAEGGGGAMPSASAPPPPHRRHYETCADVDLEQGPYLTFAQLHRLVHHTQEQSRLHTTRNLLLTYVFALILYIGLNLSLFIANFQEQDFIEENYYKIFHFTSFWGLFAFTLVEALVLITTGLVSWKNRLLSGFILFNVLMTFATALLLTFNISFFEVTAHYMEYSVQVTISAVNLIFLNTYVQSSSSTSVVYKFRNVEAVVLWLVLVFSIFQLSLFAGYPTPKIGSERAAHFAEYTTEMFNGSFTLLFAALSYSDVAVQLEAHEEATKCTPNSSGPNGFPRKALAETPEKGVVEVAA